MTSRRGRPPAPPTPSDPLLARPEQEQLKTLASHPSTRPYVVDSGFLAGFSELRTATPDGRQRLISRDPRLAQAFSVLSGINLSISEADVRHAESVGDIKKRDAVQTDDVIAALQHTTLADAKAAGNAHFQAAEYSKAVACYQRALGFANLESAPPAPDDEEVEVIVEVSDAEAATTLASEARLEARRTRATLHSNAAMALLKMARPADALSACDDALREAPDGMDTSKMLYRRAHALEGVGQFDEAVRAMERARDAARAADGAAGATRPMDVELRRLRRVQRAAAEAAEAKAAQRAEYARASDVRAAGLALPSVDGAVGKGAAGELSGTTSGASSAAASGDESDGAGEVASAVGGGAGGAGGAAAAVLPRFAPIAEQDFSHWARTTLAARVRGLTHARGGARIVIDALDEHRSDVHASVKEKRGRRALYYDLDLMCTWEGHCALGQPAGAPAGTMRGEFRLFNVGQDTRFQEGGDPHTSYLYSLGFPRAYHDDDACPLWARQLKFEAAELFDLVSHLVGAWVKELAAKAMGAHDARK